MARLVVTYNLSSDPEAFEKHYIEQHVPLTRKIPGLRTFEFSRGPVFTPAGPSSFQLVAILGFDDIAAIQAAFASPEGQAAAADAQHLGAAHILLFDETAG